jgi:hypothetical protein
MIKGRKNLRNLGRFNIILAFTMMRDNSFFARNIKSVWEMIS